MRARHPHELTAASEIAERFGALDHGQAQRPGALQLRMVLRYGRGHHERARLLGVRGVVTREKLDAEAREIVGSGRRQVAAGQPNAATDEQLR
jgi:hypothetical protein